MLDTSKKKANNLKSDPIQHIQDELSLFSESIVKIWNLGAAPEVTIDTFSRDYMEFQYFMATFKEVVESKVSDRFISWFC